MPSRTSAQALVDVLKSNEVDRVFCVPGESYLAVLDALHDANRIETVICRQEGGMAMMAEADGKLTGKPGIAFVTRGPGATNATAGLHVAMQDSTPMILFIGQIARSARDREAFQELDYRRMFGQLAKWTVEIDDPARMPELVGRAFRTATSGRPGPVVVVLPEDILEDMVQVDEIQPAPQVDLYPGPRQIAELEAMIQQARKPLVLVGGSIWDDATRANFQAWAEARSLPVIAAFRRQDRFDNTSPCYIGDMGLATNPAITAYLAETDLLIAVGARLDDITTGGYTRLTLPRPRQKLVHIHPGADELGKVFQPDLSIVASPRGLAELLPQTAPEGARPWQPDLDRLRQSYEAWQKPLSSPGALNMSEVMQQLRDNLADDAILTNGAGNYATWAHRFFRFSARARQLAPTSGSMGYGLPAAVAAKLRYPDRPVICFTGDGDFQMTSQEFGTAMQAGANFVCLVIDNGMYGTIRMHQERDYPGRVHGTQLINPDFAALARAYGATGETVTTTDQFLPALNRALTGTTPALLHLIIDPEALTPDRTLSEIRGA